LRSKEEADDYRYFPDPDLTPFNITDTYLAEIKNALPALPEALEKKYREVFHLPSYDAAVICSDKAQVVFFEALIKHTGNYKAAANWLMGPIKSYLNENNTGLAAFPVTADTVGALIQLVEEGKLSFSIASTKILDGLIQQPGSSPLQIAIALNLLQESDSNSVAAWVDEAIAKMPEKVKEYKSGKKGLIGLFAGEVKKLSKGKADMQLVNKLLTEKLN
jgi:aspartyl-tRNA(Asn)/glutamyl-tRNA(Gln) amidotransferase subunit B